MSIHPLARRFSLSLALVLILNSLASTAEPLALEENSRIQVQRFELQIADTDHLPYKGPSSEVRQAFKKGFVPAVGSGLAFQGQKHDGTLIFLGITDRGPNGDGPKVQQADKKLDSKIFSTPEFAPSVATIEVTQNSARVTAIKPIRNPEGKPISGLPLASGIGSSNEIALDDHFKPLKYDTNGLDTESIVIDGEHIWVSDEYGPFIAKIATGSGKIVQKFAPGKQASDLPMILSKRRANRGMEGLALDKTTGLLHGFLQSPLSAGKVEIPETGKTDNVHNYAPFVRWLSFNPKTGQSKLYAYPINASDYKANKTGNAKLGDLVALGSNRFITIEQGSGQDGKVFNWLMLVELSKNASEITEQDANLEKSSVLHQPVGTVDYQQIIPMKKTLLLNLNQLGWNSEKAEGLTLVDSSTLALINDNDFGLRIAVLDAQNQELSKADITECTANEQGVLQSECAEQHVRVVPAKESDAKQNLWLIRFSKAMDQYSVR